jgi:putative ABC transport system permease protein
MFQNYLHVAWRNMVNNKLYSGINITGLAVGLAACILISLFVRDEMSYDQHWQHANSLYRLHTTFVIPGREPFVTVVAQGPIKQALQQYFEQDIQAVTRFNSMDAVVTRDGASFTEEMHWTDPETAAMFDLEVLSGDIRQALHDNAALAISQSFARKHFGDEEALGRVLTVSAYDLKRDYRVAAVFQDLPRNTVMDFQVLAMIDEGDWTSAPWIFEQWFSINNTVFFQLRKGASIAAVNNRLADFADQIALPEGSISDKDARASDFIKYSTMSIGDIQLNPSGLGEMKPTGNKTTVAIFAAIAVLILVIACINFMNLATSKSTQRAREVALRKVMGATRRQLIFQFLGESVLLAVLGLLVGIVLVELLLPSYAQFLDKDLQFIYSDGLTLAVLLGLVVTVGLLGGVYPALIISGFRPARVLKANQSTESRGSARLRSALVVFQFSISIALIVATATVVGQMHYALNLDPGFNKDNLLAVTGLSRTGAAERQEAFREEVLRLPAVETVAFVSQPPFDASENNVSVKIPGHPELEMILIGHISIDYDFLDTLEIGLLAGRNYSRDYALDAYPETQGLPEGQLGRGNILVNEGALRRFGFGTPGEALGKEIQIEIAGGEETPVEALFTIIGVLGDLHFQSLRTVMRPEVYFISSKTSRNLLVRYTGEPLEIAAAVEQIWNSMIAEVPYTYEFSDEVAAEDFNQERNTATMLGMFATLAVIVACLGLYGLASFTAQRRTREIGIRKVMGASVPGIVRLLLWQFSKPVLLANLLAWPLAVWGLMHWLEGFPYRLDTWVLAPLCLFSGLVALAIAWITVGGNAARVASRNPVHALRYE